MIEAGRPVLVGTVSVEKSEVLSDAAQAARHQARGAQRQAARARGRDRRPGRPLRAVTIATNMAGRGTDILLGGNPAGLASDLLHQRGLNPAEVDKDDLRRGARRGQGDHRGRPRRGGRGGRPAHHRHGAPREPPDRQPASRPRRPPGRPGLVALLPLARRRSDEALRLGPGRRPDGAPGSRGRRRHRVAVVAGRSRAPRPASRASTSTSASASSSSTTSSTVSARRSTPSATRSSATRTSPRPSGLPRRRDRRTWSTYPPATQAPAEWDLDELAKALTAMGLSGPGTTPDDLADAADSAIRCASTSRGRATAHSTPRRSSRATRRGASPSGSCCSGRSTRCGWST